MDQKIILIKEYFNKIKSANKELTKKEAFKDLLNRLYSHSDEIKRIIDKITLGAEAAIVNIPRKDKLHRGSADTLYNKIIIEFENNLKSTYKHAKEQLAGYLLGQFNSGEGYNFTLIASDFINWKVLAPDISCIENINNLTEETLILTEVEEVSFTLTEENSSDFYFWLDRFLFKEEKQRATLKSIEEGFGYQSYVFIESFRELDKWFNDAKKFGDVQVAYEQWHRFLSIAYGSFDARESIFMIHTYMSIFSKMLAYSVISNDDFIDDDEMATILDGTIFEHYNIENFVENDLFQWVKNPRNFSKLKKVFRIIAQEISTYDFENVDEDILKGVYQELIDLDTRHALGEYYTPDWLCERIVNEYEFKRTDKILDPSCGSGSFLRAVIQRIKTLNPDIKPQELCDAVYGIDIHPLSVQIAKTTVLLAINQNFKNTPKPVQINVILANTLLVPEGSDTLFGNEFSISIDNKKYLLNTQILDNDIFFNKAIDYCEETAELSKNKKPIEIEVLRNMFKKLIPQNGINDNIIKSFYDIYLALKDVKEKNRDSIWSFILKNLYKPYFFINRFNYVIGNPPWFTFSSIKNEEYQNILDSLASKYQVKPEKSKNFPHLEIAAIFQAYCSSYFLKENGKIAFVLPRSFFSADHHDNTRSGQSQGFKIENIWDLENVSPLFRIPSCVIFSEKADNKVKRALKSTGLKGLSFSGNLPKNNCKLDVAESKITENEILLYYSKQGKSSAFSSKKLKKQKNVNPYKSKFKQGATIVPRSFYFVDFQAEIDNITRETVGIKTSESIKADSKPPWKGLNLKGRIENQFLFRTALSKSILPFALINPELIVLPIFIEKNEKGEKNILLKNSNDLIYENFNKSAKWFQNTENIWNINCTAKSRKMSSNDRVNYQKGLTSQNLNAPYLVLYNASAKDANALVLKRSNLDLEFIVESKAYVFYTNNLSEAFYLSAVLNSKTPNLMMKDFQSRGLFGARDVHKKILDIYFPKFDEKNEIHAKLAQLAEISHRKAEEYLKQNPPKQELTPLHLGKLRLEIKKYLSSEFSEIDELVKKII